MAETSPKSQHTELSRDLSLFDITMIGVGAMIGAGIFVLTGIAAGTAGPALLLVFALNGVVALFTAMVYAELGSAIPEAGGGYLWIKEGLPGGNAFLSGWMSWFAHAVAGSLYALGFGAYFGYVLHAFGLSFFGLPDPVAQKVLAVAVVMLFMYINYRGVSETGTAGNIITVSKVVILAIFVLSGLLLLAKHPVYLSKFKPFTPKGMTGVFSAMGLTFIAFEGYEIIVQAGEEVKDPRRNIPRAVFLCMAIVVPIYLLVAFVALGAVDPGKGEATWQWLGNHAETGLVEAARQFMPFGTVLLLLGGLLSTMSALNATTFSSTRVSFAMGRDRNLPDRFAKIHPRTRTPVVALLASGGIMLGMCLAVPIEHVAAASDIMFLLLFLQVNIAVITIRKKYGDKLHYGYVVPFFPLIPALGIVANFGLALFMWAFSPLAWWVALGWLAVGWTIWLFYAKPRERGKGLTPVLVREHLAEEKERYRVLVPVANPATARGLVRFAARLARVQEGEVVILHTLIVPPQLPPSAARELIREARPVVDKAAAGVERMGVPASSVVRVSHTRPWRAIVDTIEEYKVDFAVLGWRGHSRDPRTAVGSNIDKVVSHARCDVAVLQNPSTAGVERILIPVANPARAELLLSVGRLLAKRRDGRIDLLHVTAPGEGGAESAKAVVETLEKAAREALEADPDGPPVAVLTAESADPIGEIVSRSEAYGLLVVGVTTQSWFQRRAVGSAPKRIAALVECPLVLVSPGASGLKHSVQSFFHYFRNLEEQVEEEVEETEALNGNGEKPKKES